MVLIPCEIGIFGFVTASFEYHLTIFCIIVAIGYSRCILYLCGYSPGVIAKKGDKEKKTLLRKVFFG